MDEKLWELKGKVNERIERRPFNELCRKDGNFNYIHQTDVFVLVELALNEGRNSPKSSKEAANSTIDNKQMESASQIADEIESKLLGKPITVAATIGYAKKWVRQLRHL